MPTTKMPVWIRSEYVTIGQPLSVDQGTEAAPVGANRLPFAGSAKDRIPHFSPKRNRAKSQIRKRLRI